MNRVLVHCNGACMELWKACNAAGDGGSAAAAAALGVDGWRGQRSREQAVAARRGRADPGKNPRHGTAPPQVILGRAWADTARRGPTCLWAMLGPYLLHLGLARPGTARSSTKHNGPGRASPAWPKS
uniref:Uncharacterized protein n=1 Tax=Oryza sativa subsp. japonica TaxID=39947 RepID=Q6ZJG3_ORYSJ|nr:hypothetical protein [Oryza sativa Japonica Group]